MGDERKIADAYEGVLPSCACFSTESGDVDDVGQSHMTAAMNMADQVAGLLMKMGVCPTAAPYMIALMASRMIVIMSGSQVGVDSVFDMMPSIRRMHERLAELIPTHLSRSEAVGLEAMGLTEINGTC